MSNIKFISHRGSRLKYIENTLKAFVTAYDDGFRIIELDVQMSVDGKVYVYHDDDFSRLTGNKNRLCDSQSQDIDKIIQSDHLDTSYIMSLDNYLHWALSYKDLVSNLEIKLAKGVSAQYKNKFTAALCALLNRYTSQHKNIILSSFDHKLIEAIHQNTKTIEKGLLIYFEYFSKQWKQFIESSYDILVKCGCHLSVNYECLSENNIRKIKQYTPIIYIYSINIFTREMVENSISWGASGVFVDDIGVTIAARSNRFNIALIATGDEVVMGDIINTNSANIAQSLIMLGYNVSEHALIKDDIDTIAATMHRLHKVNDTIISIGGLGPTNDDVTMQAVSKYIKKPLIFNKDSWKAIVKKLKNKYDNIPETNRKQALFPFGAVIFKNPKGTAEGCLINVSSVKKIFILPGPPLECLPMFNNNVIASLPSISNNNHKIIYWQLMGIGESKLAESLNVLEKRYNIQFSYRAYFPYIELKVNSDITPACLKDIELIIDNYLVIKGKIKASCALEKKLRILPVKLTLQADCTKGYLLHKISQINLECNNGQAEKELIVTVTGMQEYWQSKECLNTKINVTISKRYSIKQSCYNEHIEVKNYQRKTAYFIFEMLCAKIIKYMEKYYA